MINHYTPYARIVQKPGWRTREDRRKLTSHFAGEVSEFFSFSLLSRTNTGFISCGQFFTVLNSQIKLVCPS